jgi:hypothetical protein
MQISAADTACFNREPDLLRAAVWRCDFLILKFSRTFVQDHCVHHILSAAGYEF